MISFVNFSLLTKLQPTVNFQTNSIKFGKSEIPAIHFVHKMHYSKALIQTKLYLCSLPFSSFSGRSQVRQNSNLPFSSTFPDFNEFSPDFPFNPVFDSNKVSPDPFPPNAYQPDPYPSEPHHSDRYTPGSSPVLKLRPEYHPEPAYQVSLHLFHHLPFNCCLTATCTCAPSLCCSSAHPGLRSAHLCTCRPHLPSTSTPSLPRASTPGLPRSCWTCAP